MGHMPGLLTVIRTPEKEVKQGCGRITIFVEYKSEKSTNEKE